MEKHSKEYAEKLAKEWYAPKLWGDDIHRDHAQHDFTQGYLKAIEEPNVKELIEALEYAKNAIIVSFENNEPIDDYALTMIESALNKSK